MIMTYTVLFERLVYTVAQMDELSAQLIRVAWGITDCVIKFPSK